MPHPLDPLTLRGDASHAPDGGPQGHARDHGPCDLESCLDLLEEPALLLDLSGAAPPWTSAAWRAACPALAQPTDLDALDAALPGLGAALATLSPRSTAAGFDLPLGPDAAWEARARFCSDGRLLLRLRDRRERVETLRRQLDDREQLLFTSRVISVGEMATTLAHELNQPIGAASNLLRGLRMRLGRRSGTAALAPRESAALDQALEQLMFAARVIARVREFTHSRQPRQQRVDIAALARESAALLDWDLQRSGVRLELDLPASTPAPASGAAASLPDTAPPATTAPITTRGDPTMLQQVLVNLMRNALDALREAPPERPLLTLSLRRDDAGTATLTVRDNGAGLSEGAESRLFVPFNSTKPTGMGVGLVICRSFVELHQGRLWFSRNADRGCSFHVELPTCTAASTATDVTPSIVANAAPTVAKALTTGAFTP